MSVKSIFMVLSGVAIAAASVTVTESSRSSLTFLFEMEGFSVSTYTVEGRTYSRLSFNDGNSHTCTAEGIGLPSRTLYAGVPQHGSATARFVSHSVRRMVLDHPLRAENLDTVAMGHAAVVFDNTWLSRIEYVRFRELRTGRFYLRPFLYDPATRTLTILEKGSCTITFPAAATRRPPAGVSHSDYYKTLRALLLNYETASSWMAPLRSAGAPKRTAVQALPANERMLFFKIGDGNSGLNEGTTSENGIIKLTGSRIIGFFGSSVPVASVALFGSSREELDSTVPAAGAIPGGVSAIPVARFDLNGNGIVDPEDYFLACVTGVGDWYYDTARGDFSFYLNRVENYRTYWIRVGAEGSAVAPFSCTAVPGRTVTSFENRLRYKTATRLTLDGGDNKGGKIWVWRRLDWLLKKFSFKVDAPDILADATAAMRINHGNYSSFNVVSVRFGGTALDSAIGRWQELPAWGDTLTVELTDGDRFFEIESVDIRYRRALDMSGKSRVRVYSPREGGVVSYRLSGMPAERTYIFRIGADESQVSLVDTVSGGGTYAWVDTAGIGVQYVISTESGLLRDVAVADFTPPVAGSKYEIRDLRRGSNGADYLVITHEDFRSEALRFVTHKESQPRFSAPRIVYVDDIYREFGGGSSDPSAIRNFLLYAYTAPNWSAAPDYVLLLGNGHYDYKGYSTPEKNYIPTAQYRQYYWKCVDDFYACITPGEFVIHDTVGPDLFLGRVPCQSLAEARAVVDKVIETEGADADFGAWRNRLLLISDDDMQGQAQIDYIPHYLSSELIDRVVTERRPATEIRKVNLFEYPWNTIYQKPEASAALFQEWNNGVGFVNFFGHGNHLAWADEGILNKEMLGNFRNRKRYPVVSAFSCSVAYFDEPGSHCLAGMLVMLPGAGSIATIASTRIAFASSNTTMGKIFYEFMFTPDASHTVGQAYMLTKAGGGGDRNLKHYALLGDPSLRFFSLTDTVEAAIYTESGALLADTLKALQKIEVRGKMARNGAANPQFGTVQNPAFVQIRLCNPVQDSVLRKDGGASQAYVPVYTLPGTPVFSGVVEVKNGLFSQSIQLPRRLTFDKPGVSLSAYAWSDGQWFGAGHCGDYIFSGTDTLVNPDDNQGPRVAIRPVYENETWNTAVVFTDRISSFLPCRCEISVWDESGVDVTGIGPDEGLSVEIDGVMQRKNINQNFAFVEGAYTRGRATIVFDRGELPQGVYTLCIRAQDMLGNVSKNDFTLEILSDENFKLGHVFNFPNPVRMHGRTKFYFYPSHLSDAWHGGVEATIRIFTLSGKLVRVFHNAKNGQEWDGTDQRGRPLTPNVYLYRVSAKMQSAGLSGKEKTVTSGVKKIVIHPPQ